MIATQQRQNFRANNEPPSQAHLLREAQYLLDRFLVHIRNAAIGQDILDAGNLPDSKAALVDALRLLIAVEKRAEIRAGLIKVGLTLASFQPGIGERMSLRPVTGGSMLSESELQAEMARHHDALERMDRAFAACASERLQLFELFRQSAEAATRTDADNRHREGESRWTMSTH